MLTYIEPCGWCSCSISSFKCPSNVEKANEPYPDLSTLSQLSTNASLSLSQHSLQSNQKTAFSAAVIRSTFSHPHDYHSRKRIDELHERMDEAQIRNFLQFINYHLSLKKPSEDLQISDFIADFSNGHILLDLIESLSSTKLKRERGRTRFHSLSNVQHVLDYLKLRLQPITISPQDIVSGNRKQILALVWIIMKVFDFPAFRLLNRNCFREKTLLTAGQDRSVLLTWLNHLFSQCLIKEQNAPQDFYLQTWINGHSLSVILKYLVPISEKYLTMQSFDYLKRINSAADVGSQRFESCLDLSNYCFHTTTVINYQDKTEISLLKYFSDLQKNVLQLVQGEQIGKLVQINPYVKQILQTIEHSAQKINVNERYLVCLADEEKENCNSASQPVERSKEQPVAVKKEHSEEVSGAPEKFDEQVLINENVEHLVSKVIEEAVKQIIATDEKLEQAVPLSFNENDESSEQTVPIFSNHKASAHSDDEEVYPSSTFDEVTSIVPEGQVKNAAIELRLPQEKIEQPVEKDHQDQLQSETAQEQAVTSDDEDKQTIKEEDAEQTVPEVAEAKALLITSEEVVTVAKEETLDEKRDSFTIAIPSQSMPSREEKEADILNSIRHETSVIAQEKWEEATALLTESKPLLAKTEEIEEKFEEPVVSLIEPQAISASVVEIEEKLEGPQAALTEYKPVLVAAEHLAGKRSERSTNTFVSESVERTPKISTQREHISVDGKANPSANKEKSQDAASGATSTLLPDKQLEKPIVKEAAQQSHASYGQHHPSTPNNSRFVNLPKKSIPLAPSIQNHSHTRQELRLQPNAIVKQPEQRKNVPIQPVVTAPIRCSQYSEAASQPDQLAVSAKKQGQATASKKKVASTFPSKQTPQQSIIITEDIQSVPIEIPRKISEPLFVPPHHSSVVKEEAHVPAKTSEETKKSRNKNKKSRRSQAKKVNAKNNSANPSPSAVDNGEEKEEEESEGSVHDEPVLPPVPEESVIEIHATPANNAHSSTSRSRKSRRKRTVATVNTTLMEKTPSSAPNRNLFVVVQECLRARKTIAFKCLIILVCLCVSILILVFSHK